MKLTGIHHLTAITAKAGQNKKFYTETLGLRLVKKTVNQDDVSAYHLFYADGLASPGTDITFFDWPATPEKRGTHSIVRTAFRVNKNSLPYWKTRFEELKVKHSDIRDLDNRGSIDFEDFEGQRLRLVADDSKEAAHPWEKSPVPSDHQICGLGPITMSVPDLSSTEEILTKVLNMRRARDYFAPVSDGSSGVSKVTVFEMGDGSASAELHVAVEPQLNMSTQGGGAVHHVAFRVPTFAEYDQWATSLKKLRIASSGPVDRFYFKSLYFREPNGILFELATDGPGFASDESLESLGEKLALPPFLEGRRAEIEKNLKPL